MLVASTSGAIAERSLLQKQDCCLLFNPDISLKDSQCCNMTVATLQRNATGFKERNKSYFTAFNNDITPSSIACPESVDEVAQLVREAVQCNAEIGVRGGGHTPWKGAANLEDRLVIDMRNLTGVTVNTEKSTVSIRAGERWGNVYETLAAEGLATIGGRVSRVGAIGLTLGGKLTNSY